MNQSAEDRLRTKREDIEAQLVALREEHNVRLEEATKLWISLTKEDRELRAALMSWSWRDKSENRLAFGTALQAAILENVSTYRFLQGAKLCIVEDKKWTMANLMRYSRLKRAEKVSLTSKAIDAHLELSDDDLDGFDFGD